jgi:hypothetical protein
MEPALIVILYLIVVLGGGLAIATIINDQFFHND